MGFRQAGGRSRPVVWVVWEGQPSSWPASQQISTTVSNITASAVRSAVHPAVPLSVLRAVPAGTRLPGPPSPPRWRGSCAAGRPHLHQRGAPWRMSEGAQPRAGRRAQLGSWVSWACRRRGGGRVGTPRPWTQEEAAPIPPQHPAGPPPQRAAVSRLAWQEPVGHVAAALLEQQRGPVQELGELGHRQQHACGEGDTRAGQV